MLSGDGAGNAVLGWLSTAGSSTSMTARSCPSSRDRRSAVVMTAIGAASVSMNPIAGLRQRRIDRQVSRPGLQHRQHGDDGLG